MGFLTELAIGFGRVVSSQVAGASNAVLLSLKFLEDFDDEDSGEASTEEPYYRGLGLYGRPRDAVSVGDATGNNPAGEAEVLAWRLDDRNYTLGFRDLRVSAKANPDKGELGIAHYGGGFLSMKMNGDEDGTSIVLYAPHNDGDGVADKAHAISLDTTAANSHVSIVHHEGQSITLTKEGSIILMAADGTAYLEVKNGDVVFSATSISFPGGAQVGATTPADGFGVLIGDPVWTTFMATLVAGYTTMAAAFNAAPGPMLSAPGTVAAIPLIPPIPSTKLKAAI